MLTFCSLASGSRGNSLFVSSGRTNLIVDMGLSCKKIVEKLKDIGCSPESLTGVLITHEHSDHIRGLKVFCKKYRVPVYAVEAVWSKMGTDKMDPSLQKDFLPNRPFAIDDFWIDPFSLPHDAADPVGFSLYAGRKKVSIAADLGFVPPYLLQKLQDSDCVYIEANHDEELLKKGPYPEFLKKRILSRRGHLSNACAGQLLAELFGESLPKVVLGHLSEKNNRPDLAAKTIYASLVDAGVPKEEIHLSLSEQKRIGEMISLA